MTRLDTIDGAGRPLRRFADNYTMAWRLVHALAAVYYCTVYDLWRSDDDGVLSATTSVSDLKRRRYTYTHRHHQNTTHAHKTIFRFICQASFGGWWAHQANNILPANTSAHQRTDAIPLTVNCAVRSSPRRPKRGHRNRFHSSARKCNC